MQDEINLGFENFKILDNTSRVIEESDVIYVIVPTPSLKDGTFDTKCNKAMVGLEKLQSLKNLDTRA